MPALSTLIEGSKSRKMSSVAVIALVDRVRNVIQLNRDAGDITHAEIIGALEIIKLDIYKEMQEVDDDDDDEFLEPR